MSDNEEIENNVNNNVEYYVAAVRTSMSKDYPFWYRKNRLVEIYIECLKTGEFYSQICDPGIDLNLPDVSLKPWSLSKKRIQDNGIATSKALKELTDFVDKTRSSDNVVLFVYEAEEFLNIIAKELYIELGMDLGKNFHIYPYQVFDLLSFMQQHIEELDFTYEPKYEPYSLDRIAKHYSIEVPYNKYLTAAGDAFIMRTMLFETIYPALKTSENKYLSWKWLFKNKVASLTAKNRKLTSIPGIDKETAASMNDIVNNYLVVHGTEDLQTHIHNPELFTVADLLLYASMKLRLNNQKDEGELSLWHCCQIIERMMRKVDVDIQSDLIIASVLASMVSSTLFDFIYHTSKHPDKVFPTIRQKNSICFEPLKLSENDSFNIAEKLGYNSIMEIMGEYEMVDIEGKDRLVSSINNVIIARVGNKHLVDAIDQVKRPQWLKRKEKEEEEKPKKKR